MCECFIIRISQSHQVANTIGSFNKLSYDFEDNHYYHDFSYIEAWEMCIIIQ